MVGDVESSIALNIPKGALDKKTKITALYKDKEDEISETPLMNFLGAAEFGPSGTVFKEPVEVSMKLTKVPNGSEISVFCYDEENKIWDYVTEATCEGDIAKFKVTHFSTYKCLDIGKAT